MGIDYEKVQELRSWLGSESGLLVGGEDWPVGDVRVVLLGSPSDSLNPDVVADDLAELAIDAVALPKNPTTPNVYPFVATNWSEGSADIIEKEWSNDPRHPIVITLVSAAPIEASLEKVEEVVAAARRHSDLFGPSDEERLITIPQDEPLYPNQWVFLQVNFWDKNPISPAVVKLLLEDAGYRVVNPLEGFFGLFERIFSREDFSTSEYTRVLLNPGQRADLTARQLNEEVFSSFGAAAPENLGLYRVWGTFVTTPALIADQGVVEDLAWWQGKAIVFEDTVDAGGESLGGVLRFLQQAFSVLPFALYLGAGVGVAWLLWEGYKYVREEGGQ